MLLTKCFYVLLSFGKIFIYSVSCLNVLAFIFYIFILMKVNFQQKIKLDLPVFNVYSNIFFKNSIETGSRWKMLGLSYNPILESDTITGLAGHYDYVVAHVILRWSIHVNVTVIPRYKVKSRIPPFYLILVSAFTSFLQDKQFISKFFFILDIYLNYQKSMKIVTFFHNFHIFV